MIPHGSARRWTKLEPVGVGDEGPDGRSRRLGCAGERATRQNVPATPNGPAIHRGRLASAGAASGFGAFACCGLRSP